MKIKTSAVRNHFGTNQKIADYFASIGKPITRKATPQWREFIPEERAKDMYINDIKLYTHLSELTLRKSKLAGRLEKRKAKLTKGEK